MSEASPARGPAGRTGRADGARRALGDRLQLTLTGLAAELAGAARLSADPRSLSRFSADALGYRAQRILPLGRRQRPRTVHFKGGTTLAYRLNRGDVRAIAEVWIARAYELPFDLRPRNILDLGANIGATSVWLWRHYGATRLIAVEPVPANAELLSRNLRANEIEGEVVQAAVAAGPGTARFELSANSTWGRLGPEGIEVQLVSAQSLVDRFPDGESIDLVKVDVEGAEQELFGGETEWLERVGCLLVELHSDRVDAPALVRAIERRGFTSARIGEQNRYSGASDLNYVFRRP